MKEPLIGIDSRMIQNTGIGTYLRNLLTAAAGLKHDGIRLFGEAGQSKNLPYPVQNFQAPIYSLKEQWLYPGHLKTCDLWHAPHYNIPLFKPSKTKLVVTIHDLIHWVFKDEYFSTAQNVYAYVLLSAAVQKSDHIITVSQHTKNDLIHFLNADENKISVIYEAVEDHFQIIQDQAILQQARQTYKLPEKYFLHIGSLKPHKNIQWLIRQFRAWHAEGKVKTPLVLVGKKDKSYRSEYKELQELVSDSVIIHVPNVTEITDLVKIYNGATALIHPSLYEGFGLTLLEAMACGTPVITCPNASIPEVVSENACLVDSGSKNDMMQAVQSLETNPHQRETWRSKGLEQVKKFSWQKTAAQTLQVYETILHKQGA